MRRHEQMAGRSADGRNVLDDSVTASNQTMSLLAPVVAHNYSDGIIYVALHITYNVLR